MLAHAGLPGQQPGWAGEWFAFHMVWAYFWLFNIQNKALPPLVADAMGEGAPSDGMFHSSGEYIMLHSVLLMDALIAHVRFDGLSSVDLLPEIGRVCGFEEGECTLCWAGPFASFVATLSTPTSDWMILDSKTGVRKRGVFTAAQLNDPSYKKPSDCTKLLALVQAAGENKKKA